MTKLVMVFSGKDLAKIQIEGGSGHWIAKTDRIEEAEYVLCVRNRRETWAAKDFEHGTAFLVGRISGTKPAPYDKRIIITMSEYAEIQAPDAWKICTGGQRYPVAYKDADVVQKQLNIDFSKLDWHPFVNVKQVNLERDGVLPLSIQQAKLGLAKSFNVGVEAIEITIRS